MPPVVNTAGGKFSDLADRIRYPHQAPAPLLFFRSTTTNPTEIVKRLEVLRIVNEAYQFVWLQRQDFALLGVPIVLVLGTASALLSYFRPVPNTDVQTVSVGFILAGVVVAVVSLAGWVVFAVAWHRRCLLPNHGSIVGQELRWQRRHSVFLGRTVVLGLLTIVLSMFLALPIRFLIAATGGAAGVITAALWMTVVFHC